MSQRSETLERLSDCEAILTCGHNLCSCHCSCLLGSLSEDTLSVPQRGSGG